MSSTDANGEQVGAGLSSLSFGQWLQRRRKEYGYTQDELAQKAGCSVVTVQRIEEGVRRPSRQLAELLAEALEIAPGERAAFVQWSRVQSLGKEPSNGRDAKDHGADGDRQETAPVVIANPYKGLSSFYEADAPDFFGREALTSRMVARLSAGAGTAHFLAVVGPSGSGKSSLVRAGLLPTLRHTGLPAAPGYPLSSDVQPAQSLTSGPIPVVVDMVPGTHPLEELEAGLLRVAANPPSTLLDQLLDSPRGLLRAAKRVLPLPQDTEGGTGAGLLLFIDQFEEMFTLARDDAARLALLDSLYEAAVEPRSPVWVVVTLRADFYDRPLAHAKWCELLRDHTELVSPMSAEELHRAIVGPAGRVGVDIEPALVAAIQKDVDDQPGMLPLMEYALTELFEQRDGSLLTIRSYRASGGVRGALDRRSEEIYTRLSPAEQEEAKRLFGRLVTLGEGVEDTRRRARRAELASAAVDEEALDRVLEAFGRYRLLTFDRDALTQGPTVEIAHEALLKSWERLRDWLDGNRADLRTQRQLTLAAGEWENAGRDPSFLAGGTRLAAFEALANAENGPGGASLVSLTAEEHAYVQASVARRERERTATRRRVRLAIGGLLAALAVISVFALIAFVQAGIASREARAADEQRSVALSREVAAESLAGDKGDTMRSLLLALEAARISPTSESENAIRQALLELQPPHLLYDAPEASGSMDFSPDSKRVVVAEHGPVRVRDAQSGDVLLELEHKDLIDNIAYSPDGKWIAGGSRDHSVWIWDAQSGRTIATLTGHRAPIFAVAFSPDSKLVASGSADSTARVWAVSNGSGSGGSGSKPQAQLLGHTGPINSVQFSPDGKQALTASDDKTARVWDAATGRQLLELDGHRDIVNMAVFSSDGKLIITAGQDKTARLWDASTGREVARLAEHTDSVNAARFSRDGRWLATASNDGTSRIWDVAAVMAAARSRKQPSSHLVLQSGPSMDASFSEDGKWVVTTCSSPGPGHQWVARVWEVGTGSPVAQLGGQDFVHDGPYTRPYPAARFSPDGKWLLVADGHAIGWIMQWEFYQPLDHLLAIAPSYGTRQLTCEEQRTYLHEETACRDTATTGWGSGKSTNGSKSGARGPTIGLTPAATPVVSRNHTP